MTWHADATRLARRAVGLLALFMVAVPASALAAPPAPVGSTPRPVRGSSAAGALPSSTPLSLTVVLAPRDPAALSRFVQEVSTPGSPLYRHYLARGQFGPRFGASPQTITAVSAALRAAGLSPGPPTSNDLSIPVQASAATAATALHVRFNRYRLPSGRLGFANTSRPLLPASVAPSVRDIVGLQTLFVPHVVSPIFRNGHTLAPAARALGGPTSGPAPCSAASSAASGSGAYTVNQVAEGYNLDPLYSGGALGAGTTIGVYELEPNRTTDISNYTSCFGVNPTISYVKVDGGAGSGAGSGEAALDIENVAGIAPASHIEVFQGPDSGTGPLDVFQQMATQDNSQINTTSWGECEPDMLAGDPNSIADEETILQQMATQGQTLFAAAGDTGSEDCLNDGTANADALAVDDPGSQTEVTSVGGTSFESGTNPANGYSPGDSTPLAIPPFQTVWNQSPTTFGAGGGGVSSVHVWPSYQSLAPASLNVQNANSSAVPCGTSAPNECREVPDVSADADPYSGYEIYFNGQWVMAGGTSAAAPVWAGILALINSDSADGCTSPGPFGELNPLLYAIAGGAHSASALTDITTPAADHPSNNDYTGGQNGLYPVGPGYDMATGLGTPLVGGTAGLAQQLCALRSGPIQAPVNRVPPLVSGVAQQGQTLTDLHGAWTNLPTSMSYQWEDCDTSGNNCSNVPGATSQTYTLASGDVGHTIRVAESATNAIGMSSPATSAQTAIVTPFAPSNTAPPAVSGTAQQGDVLSTTTGSWNNNPTSYTYAWEDCDSSGQSCALISGATSSSYTLTPSDVGHTIRVVVTARNAGGSSSSPASAQTAVVFPLPPANLSPPSISGNTTEQQTLTLQRGTWSNGPTSVNDQWEDCNASGGGCVPIAGATGSTDTLTAADVGDTIRVQERAANAGGAATTLSAATGVVQAPVFAASATIPHNGSIPVISGTARVGNTLSVSTGTWAGTPPLSYAFQWQRCAPTCASIAGATGASYKLVAADAGARVRAVVSASNGAGSAQAASGQVGPVAAALPTPAQIRAALQKVLAPTGKAAKIGALLKKGGYVVSFRAPSAGRLMIDWYLVPPGARPRKGVRPILVATAAIVFHRAGPAKLEIRLTSAGRNLLRRSNVLELTAKDTFTPTGGLGVTMTRTFKVRR